MEGLCPAGPRSFAGQEAPPREAKRGQACFSRACTLRRAEPNSLGPIMDGSREDREGHLKLQIWVLLLKRVPCVYASAQRSQAPEVPGAPWPHSTDAETSTHNSWLQAAVNATEGPKPPFGSTRHLHKPCLDTGFFVCICRPSGGTSQEG